MPDISVPFGYDFSFTIELDNPIHFGYNFYYRNVDAVAWSSVPHETNSSFTLPATYTNGEVNLFSLADTMNQFMPTYKYMIYIYGLGGYSLPPAIQYTVTIRVTSVCSRQILTKPEGCGFIAFELA